MNQSKSSLKYLAIKQLLLYKLQVALEKYCNGTDILKSQIRLHQIKQQPGVYVCAIAYKLTDLKFPPQEIAIALAELVLSQDGQYFTVWVVAPGLIYLKINDSYLATWLQHLIQSPPSLQTSGHEAGGQRGKGRKEQRGLGDNSLLTAHCSLLFLVQYTHARCCSILQLAHREKLITLQPRDSDLGSVWLVVTPNTEPWDTQQCLSDPAGRTLIFQLMAILDDLYCPDPFGQPTDCQKAALNLSQAFQTFYSQCRIWGEVKSQNIQLAQARLGLVLITQSVLRLLLQQLGIIAPSEL